MLACSPERMSGKRLSELGYRIHTEADNPFTEADHPVRRVLTGGKPVRDLPLQLHRPDGSARTMLLTARALSGGGGDPSERRDGKGGDGECLLFHGALPQSFFGLLIKAFTWLPLDH